MEQQFIAVSEKAPRLEELEAEPAQKFLVLYDSYVHRNVLGGATVPMASCLEKEDLLELLEETGEEVLTVLAEAQREQNGMAQAISEEEAPVASEGSNDESLEEQEGSLSSQRTVSRGGIGVRSAGPMRYVDGVREGHVGQLLGSKNW